mmetsp:Transcript_19797/g.50035  ORF Transcript_19797/g.50035 Transcript_19797/m.50035 type:complete len:206 (-) Transcript_19797:350-967(-)
MVSCPRGKEMEICFRMGGVVFSFAAGGAAEEPRPRPPRDAGEEGSDWASAPALVAASAASARAAGVPSAFLRLTLKVSREVSERFGGALPPPRPPPPSAPSPPCPPHKRAFPSGMRSLQPARVPAHHLQQKSGERPRGPPLAPRRRRCRRQSCRCRRRRSRPSRLATPTAAARACATCPRAAGGKGASPSPRCYAATAARPRRPS